MPILANTQLEGFLFQHNDQWYQLTTQHDRVPKYNSVTDPNLSWGEKVSCLEEEDKTREVKAGDADR